MNSIACIFLLFSALLQSPSDQEIAENVLIKVAEEKQSPADNMVSFAKSFIGTPYVANTLEVNENESLVINLREMDCTTFVENCLALTLTAQSYLPTFNTYCNNLQDIRYRNSIIDGYTSRLHYSTDWIYNNDSAGVIHDITKEIGGKELPLKVNFMSTHPDSYSYLTKHPEKVARIKETETSINNRKHYYIPKNEISSCISHIENGDLIFFVTSIAGLDISHMGIAYWKKGKLTFIHASTKAMKVIINPETLAVYCNNSKSNKGIIVCRIKDPLAPL